MIIEAGVIVVLATIAYLDRKSLKADAVAAKAEVVLAGDSFVTAIRTKESQVRAKIFADVSKVVDAAKADAIRIEAEVKAELTNIEGAVSGLVVKVEADLKKII